MHQWLACTWVHDFGPTMCCPRWFLTVPYCFFGWSIVVFSEVNRWNCVTHGPCKPNKQEAAGPHGSLQMWLFICVKGFQWKRPWGHIAFHFWGNWATWFVVSAIDHARPGISVDCKWGHKYHFISVVALIPSSPFINFVFLFIFSEPVWTMSIWVTNQPTQRDPTSCYHFLEGNILCNLARQLFYRDWAYIVLVCLEHSFLQLFLWLSKRLFFFCGWPDIFLWVARCLQNAAQKESFSSWKRRRWWTAANRAARTSANFGPATMTMCWRVSPFS